MVKLLFECLSWILARAEASTVLGPALCSASLPSLASLAKTSLASKITSAFKGAARGGISLEIFTDREGLRGFFPWFLEVLGGISLRYFKGIHPPSKRVVIQGAPCWPKITVLAPARARIQLSH